MNEINRKTIPLCKEYYAKLHNKEYNSMRLKDPKKFGASYHIKNDNACGYLLIIFHLKIRIKTYGIV